ncbi:hypothetical protein A3860_07600 [Niastella vici]|uniref:Uncharacterized protein n=1 Tax=Niastella vici TaxID=1703345 RepID=A0A1V9FIL8_9BACT|nr:hypothetical protein A3860_07600 [Niastella vici]
MRKPNILHMITKRKITVLQIVLPPGAIAWRQCGAGHGTPGIGKQVMNKVVSIIGRTCLFTGQFKYRQAAHHCSYTAVVYNGNTYFRKYFISIYQILYCYILMSNYITILRNIELAV